MYREIGGDHWLSELELQEIIAETNVKDEKIELKYNEYKKSIGLDDSDVKLLYSGRTAIDCIIEDIMYTQQFKKVYMPSYCCASMIQPFIDRGIEVEFYQVDYNDDFVVNISINVMYDVFFIMNYFGYSNQNSLEYIKKIKKNGARVIEDCTHSYMLDSIRSDYSDYQIISLRKWSKIVCGALAVKRHGIFREYIVIEKAKKSIDEMYIYLTNKDKYIKGELIDKNKFLNVFHRFNEEIYYDYKHIAPGDITKALLLNEDRTLIKRGYSENAKYIHERLKIIDGIKPMFEFNIGDCPLYVPVILDENTRTKLQKKLIANNVYVPIHWIHNKRPKYLQGESNCYNMELSLICDYRYSLEEIGYMMDIIEVFMKKRDCDHKGGM